VTVGTFRYVHTSWRRGESDEVFVEDYRGVYSLACPICGQRSRLRKKMHPVRVDRRGRITIGRAIMCPKRECGWFVRVEKGVALDTRESSRVTGPGTPAVEPPPRKHCRDRGVELSASEKRGLFS